MRISVVTPTCDRPVGIRLLEKYVARQTVKPDEWIVADGGKNPAPLTMGQVHIRNQDRPGARNFTRNVIEGMKAATGDIVVLFEDDDAYSANHIERCVLNLQSSIATGSSILRYFNIKHKCYVVMNNRGSALCQTAFVRSAVPKMIQAAQEAYRRNDFYVDRRFWTLVSGTKIHQEHTVTGIKGLPGLPGLGIGHRPRTSTSKRWVSDDRMLKLREWIGEDAEAYLCL